MASYTTDIPTEKEEITLSVQKLVEEFNKLGALTGKLSEDMDKEEDQTPLEVLEGLVKVLTQHTAVTAALSSVVIMSLKANKLLEDRGVVRH